MIKPNEHITDSKEEYIERKIKEYEFDTVFDELKRLKVKEAIELFNIPSDNQSIKAWRSVNVANKFDIAKLLLRPIKTDIFPLERQFNTFINLLHINLLGITYTGLVECTFESKYTSKYTLNINPLIPKKYYDTIIQKLYLSFESFQIPLEYSTEFLEELLEIWYLRTIKKYSSYKIAQLITPFDADEYTNKQIDRKIDKLQNLLSSYKDTNKELAFLKMKELGLKSILD